MKIDDVEKVLREIRQKVALEVSTEDVSEDSWAVTSLQFCLSLISDLREENESLWFLLDEMRSSEWTQAHTEELSKSITEHLSMLKLMKLNKGEA